MARDCFFMDHTLPDTMNSRIGLLQLPRLDLSRLEWFIPTLLFLLVFAMAARTPIDSDLWWHMRAGEETWISGSPITTDTMSFTRSGESWINHSWLSQVIFYLAFRGGSYLALSAIVALCAAIGMTFVYLQMDGAPLFRAFLIVLASAVAAPVWSARPQIFSLLFLGVLGYLYYLFKWRGKNLLWIIAPLFVLWSNSHGGYALGIIYFAAVIAGEVLAKIFNSDDGFPLSWKQIYHLALWALIGWVVVAINPNGPSMWAIPFKTIDVGVLREYIEEWQSPDFHELTQQPFIWMFLLTLGAIGFSRRKLEWSDFTLVAVFTYLAFLARRNMGPFSMVAAPVLARYLSPLRFIIPERLTKTLIRNTDLSSRSYGKSHKGLPRKFILGVNLCVLILATMAVLFKLIAVTEPKVVAKYNTQYYPVEAVSWIKTNKPEGRMFNAYQWGGYLAWEMRELPVFVDGRTDLYDDDILGAYLTIVDGDIGWEQTLNDFAIDLILVETIAGVVDELSETQEWVQRYRDDVAVVFVRK